MPTPSPRFFLHRAGKIAARTVGTSIALIAASAATAQATEGGEPPTEPTDAYTTSASDDVPGTEQQSEPAHADETPAEEAHNEEAPAEQSHHEDPPVDEAPAEEAHHEEAPAEEAPAKEAHHEDPPVDEAPAEEVHDDKPPTDQSHHEEAPTEEAPAEEARVEEIPAEEAADEEQSVDQAPEQTPVEEAAPVEADAAETAGNTSSKDQFDADAAPVETPAEVIPAETAPAETTQVETAPVEAARTQTLPVEAAPMPEERPESGPQTGTSANNQSSTADATTVATATEQEGTPGLPQSQAPVPVRVETTTREAGPARSVPAGFTYDRDTASEAGAQTGKRSGAEALELGGDTPHQDFASITPLARQAGPTDVATDTSRPVPEVPEWWTMLFTPRDEQAAATTDEGRASESKDPEHTAKNTEDTGDTGSTDHESSGPQANPRREDRSGGGAAWSSRESTDEREEQPQDDTRLDNAARNDDQRSVDRRHDERDQRDEADSGDSGSDRPAATKAPAAEGKADKDTRRDEAKDTSKAKDDSSTKDKDEPAKPVTAERIKAWLEEIVSPPAKKADKAEKSDKVAKPDKSEPAEKDDAPAPKWTSKRDDDRDETLARVVSRAKDERSKDEEPEESARARPEGRADEREKQDEPAAPVRRRARGRASAPSPSSPEESQAPESDVPGSDTTETSAAETQRRSPAPDAPTSPETPEAPAHTAPVRTAPAHPAPTTEWTIPGLPGSSRPSPWIGPSPTPSSGPTPQHSESSSRDVPGLHTPDPDESRLVPAPLPAREYTSVPGAEVGPSPTSSPTRPEPRKTTAARDWPSGLFADNKALAAQRGRAADVLVVEADGRSWGTLASLATLDTVRSSDAQIVVRTPMLPARGFTLRECSAGTYKTQWTTFAKKLAGLRNPPIIDLGPALNDSGHAWAGNPQGYASCFGEVARAVKAAAPRAVFQWTPAIGSRPGMPGDSVLAAWPGADVVDVVGVDSPADGRPWSEQVNGAYGLNYWASFADRHGKRVAVARWGVRAEAAADTAANPSYIRNMHDWVARIAATKALAYEAYSEPSDVSKEIAAAYRALF